MVGMNPFVDMDGGLVIIGPYYELITHAINHWRLTMSFFNDPLDNLLSSAMREQANRRVKSSPGKTKKELAEEIRQNFHSTFTNPENWEARQGIALIHKGENEELTFLGNFREMIHIRQKGVRKLVREEGPMTADRQEYVTGSWWLSQQIAHRISPSEEVEDREVILDVVLKGLDVRSERVSLTIRLLRGAFFRVELMEQTKFVNPESTAILFFPAGLDILEGMTFETKMALREKLEIEA